MSTLLQFRNVVACSPPPVMSSSSSPASCATCASLLTTNPEDFDTKTEKPLRNKTLSCCGRIVCASCIALKPHLATYCLYCQPTRLQTLHREDCQVLARASVEHPTGSPPPYTAVDSNTTATSTDQPDPNHDPRHPPGAPRLAHARLPPTIPPPPSYAEHTGIPTAPTNPTTPPTPPPEQDVIHHLHPTETLAAVSLAYNVPVAVLRAHNNIASDHLIYARRMLSVPWTHYQGPSKAAEPVGGHEECERKTKLRRFMTKTKCADYKEAETYMADAHGDLEAALETWAGDEAWMRAHPMPKTAKEGAGKGKRRG